MKCLCSAGGAVSLLLIVLCSPASGQSPDDELRAAATHLNTDRFGRFSSLSSADEPVKVTGQLQIRYTVNHRENVTPGEDDAVGFHARRTKIKFAGDVEDFDYRLSLRFSRDGGDAALQSAYVRYRIDDWKLSLGQFKLPYSRENLVSSSRQLAVDRSVANSFFSIGRSQGVKADWEDDTFHAAIAISDGRDASNEDFDSDNEADYALTGRGEIALAGDDWDRFDQFTSFRGGSFGLMIGAGIHYQSGGESFETDDEDETNLTADMGLVGDGWSAFAAVLWTSVEPDSSDSESFWGVVAQSGVFVTDSWELFGRFDGVYSEGFGDLSTLTIGANRYLIPESHAAKFSADAQFFLDAQSPSAARESTATALLESDQDSQWALRLQFQLLF